MFAQLSSLREAARCFAADYTARGVVRKGADQLMIPPGVVHTDRRIARLACSRIPGQEFFRDAPRPIASASREWNVLAVASGPVVRARQRTRRCSTAALSCIHKIHCAPSLQRQLLPRRSGCYAVDTTVSHPWRPEMLSIGARGPSTREQLARLACRSRLAKRIGAPNQTCLGFHVRSWSGTQRRDIDGRMVCRQGR
jgi:hypothetical protein